MCGPCVDDSGGDGIPLLLQLDDDSLRCILVLLGGPPPAHAKTLSRVASTTRRLRAVVESAAAVVVEQHMAKARAEYARLRVDYEAHLAQQPELRAVLPGQIDLDLDGPVAAVRAKVVSNALILTRAAHADADREGTHTL